MTSVREPRKLPAILSPQEVARLLDAAPGLKYQAALSLAYGAGSSGRLLLPGELLQRALDRAQV